MKTFKVIFAKNEIVVCLESNARMPREKDIMFEQNNGNLIYALVRASDISDACHKANSLVGQVKR
ncbi:hypothetical protein [Polluticoccus soli]|uniref:hypothetical protein n=1 Tax=Polluticoccus soli TaxID=3034150 RepID=UPI0023E0F756|nr:hypothetical protein [Flavipsychrobacter sp. JY13-12]